MNTRHGFGLPGDPGVDEETLNSQGGLKQHNLVNVTVQSFWPSDINLADLTIHNCIKLYGIVSCSGVRLFWKPVKTPVFRLIKLLKLLTL